MIPKLKHFVLYANFLVMKLYMQHATVLIFLGDHSLGTPALENFISLKNATNVEL